MGIHFASAPHRTLEKKIRKHLAHITPIHLTPCRGVHDVASDGEVGILENVEYPFIAITHRSIVLVPVNIQSKSQPFFV